MELPEKGWLLRIVNNLEVGKSVTIKNNGTGVLRVNKHLIISSKYYCIIALIRLQLNIIDYKQFK